MRGMLNLQIAIDGPAASGKGTIAKNVSKILGFHYLDTGLLYRGIAWLALNAQIDLDDVQNILPLVAQLEPNNLDNTLLSQHHIGSAASQIAIHPPYGHLYLHGNEILLNKCQEPSWMVVI